VLEPADVLDPLLGVGRVPAEAPVLARRTHSADPGDANARLLRELQSSALTTDELAAITRLPFDETLRRLVELELEGRVERLPGSLFRARAQ
jgi:DNA processing protein